MEKIQLYVMYDEKGGLILTNEKGETYISGDEELMEFISNS